MDPITASKTTAIDTSAVLAFEACEEAFGRKLFERAEARASLRGGKITTITASDVREVFEKMMERFP